VLGISATMSFHLAYVSDLVKAVREGSRGDRVKVLLGGHPFNVSGDLWRVVGGDGYAANADAAVGRAEALVRGERIEA
jgi:methanogenic corrinoid protein MtbC1